MNDNALISVIMPAYNSEKYITEAINSVVKQIYNNIELIIIDDGSTDNTAKIVKDLTNRSDIKIIYVKQSNGGPAKARNSGILLSKGTWISFIDSDDYWTENHLQNLYDKAITDDVVGLVYGSKVFVDDEGNELPLSQQPNWELPEGWIFSNMFANNYMNTSSVLVKRDVLFDVELFNESSLLNICEDYDLFLKLTAITKVASLKNVKYYYRRHATNITHDNVVRARGLITAVDNATKLLKNGRVSKLNNVKDINISKRMKYLYEHAVLCAYYSGNVRSCRKFAFEGIRRRYITPNIIIKAILSYVPVSIIKYLKKLV